MFRVLFLLFVIIPIIEIAVLMNVGALIGPWSTVAIVVVTAWLGAKNVKAQGVATLTSVQTKMAQGQMPNDEIVAGLLLLVAGVLLVTPGFVTDFFGLSLLVPAVRSALVNTVQAQLVASQKNGASFQFHSSQSFQGGQSPFDQSGFQEGNTYDHEPEVKDPFEKKIAPKSSHQSATLDGEYERKD